MSIDIRTVRTDTFEMDYFRFGEGERTFVILPGLSIKSVMLSADLVAAQYKEMHEGFTTCVFDRRKEVPEVCSIEDMARDTAEAMKALGLRDVCLFGASQGGMIAMVIAMEHPELVDKLILGSTAARSANNPVLNSWKQFAREGRAVDLYLEFGKDIYPAETFEAYRNVLTDIGRSVTQEELKRFLIMAGALDDFDVMDRLNKIECPVFVIGSKDDGVIPAEETQRMIDELKDRPGFRSFMYEGYGHACFDTAPDYREKLLEFMNE